MFKPSIGCCGVGGTLPSQHLPCFQHLEMMEEEEEGEVPAFQQFGTKVLAVMKPPPEEEQPRDRVCPVDQSGSGSPSHWVCTPKGASQPLERLYLPEKFLLGPDTRTLFSTEAPVTRGDPPAFPFLLLLAEDERPGEAAWRSLSPCLHQGCTRDGGQPLQEGNRYVLGDRGSLSLPS